MPKDKDRSGSTRYSTEEGFYSSNAKSRVSYHHNFCSLHSRFSYLPSLSFSSYYFPYPFSVLTPLFCILSTILILLMSCVVCGVFFTITSVLGIAPFTTLFGTRSCDLLSDFLCVLHQNALSIKPYCNSSHLSYSLNIAVSIHLFRCFSKFPTHVTMVMSIPHKYHFM